MYNSVRFLPAGDTALVIEFGNEVSEEINRKVKILYSELIANPVNGIIEAVPSFRSLLIYYRPEIISFSKLVKKIKAMPESIDNGTKARKKIVHIPVLYGGTYGEDIANVAKHNNISVEEVIAIHSEKPYLIYMMGFLPGFPYLGGLDKRLVTPRLNNPRTKIPAGSVGIGGEQTGIYPVASPGGWQLIGRTPLMPYSPKRKNPFLYEQGDYIKFDRINENEYKEIEVASASDSYSPVTEVK